MFSPFSFLKNLKNTWKKRSKSRLQNKLKNLFESSFKPFGRNRSLAFWKQEKQFNSKNLKVYWPKNLRKREGKIPKKTLLLTAAVAAVPSLWWLGTSLEKFLSKNEQKKYQPLGKIIEIEGQKIHAHLQGAGEVTVVFDHSLDSASFNFGAIVRHVNQFARTLTFDRPGYGFSQSTKTYSLENNSQLIAKILDKMEIDGPLILVGHSLGAWNMRLFLEQTEREVLGLVLLDPLDEVLFLQDKEIKKLATRVFAYLFTRQMLMRSGLMRVLSRLGVTSTLNGVGQAHLLNAQENALSKAYYAYYQNSVTAFQEARQIQESAKRILEIDRKNSKIREKMLTIIGAKQLWQGATFPGISKSEMEKVEKIHRQMHQNLLELSSQAKLVIAPSSGHLTLNTDQPELIAQEIKQIWEKGKGV